MKDQIQALLAPKDLPDTEIFTGETLVDKLAGDITRCWHQSTSAILELAGACAKADRQLAGPAKQALIAKLPFDRATFSKLVRIGDDLRLAVIAPRLPQSFSTLYELSKFDDVQLDTAIKSNAIHPAVTRREILALAAEGDTATPRDISEENKSRLSALKTLWAKASDADRKQFIEWCIGTSHP